MTTTAGTGKSYAVVTKSDTVPVPGEPVAFYVGTTGDVYLKASDAGASVPFKNVPSGTTLPFGAKYVMAATTAADINAIY